MKEDLSADDFNQLQGIVESGEKDEKKGISTLKIAVVVTFASGWVRNSGDLILLQDHLGHNSIEGLSAYVDYEILNNE